MSALTGILYAALIAYLGGWYTGYWSGNFSLLLFILSVVTLAYWLAERFHFAPQRAAAAKVLEQHDRLVVIELSSYRFTGGAHGIPGRAYLNYDRQLHKVLSLQDMLVPGEEQAFWQTVQLAHQAWLAANGHDQDADFLQTWPFERTDNIALNFGAVLLKYDIDRIAPYSSGHPELKIPYPRLNGILKPYYFPGRG